MKQIRVVVADDHPLFREGLVATIDSLDNAIVVAEASTGAEAVEAVRATKPDVIVMDLHMPVMNGIEATRQVVAKQPGIAVMVLTMVQEDDALFAALDAGAMGYLLKEADRAQIVRALESVASGEAVLGSSVAPRVLSSIGRSNEQVLDRQAFPQLSRREFEILDLLAAGLTNPAIASQLFLSEKTVRNYVSTLFSKLHVNDRAAAVAKARDIGSGRLRNEPGGSKSSARPPV